MESIISNFNDYVPYVIVGMSVIILLLFILVIVLLKAVNRLENRYRKLMRGTSNKNLEELLINELESIEKANKNSKEALDRCDSMREKIKDCVQKVAIMRYKAFEDVGSDLSFSVAILDGNNDGVMLTGIYGRQESTTYAKPIDKGISRYDLSEEEVYVLNEANNKRKK
ncbi:DUF4446 family protein [Clostridium sp. SHJSY1]|uniref:DUF4446 family protein n=1 Tax=Clostridium sp. SHJSY1 TaxID=2942483 RepID=UPI00287659EC|nr:DUF4446 family protein [Clostridium sp. SHJSY1]MDS0527923.1 DUF4446 family protein [Clostridium sp. SHJSY1]